VHPLDNPVWASLTGPHGGFAQRHGQALRYPPDVSPWSALPCGAGAQAWRDLAVLAGPGSTALVAGDPRTPPAGWDEVARIPGVQMVAAGLVAGPDDEAEVLGVADVPEMIDLVARTRPGPFVARTRQMGTYLGIRRGGVLVAMAGERLRPPGYSEISAVCTDAAHRGQGLGSRLVRAVGTVIRDRGDVPFLHAAADNVGALRLYVQLGFAVRREVEFAAFRVPAQA
jgi:ribosomal protein S18 acetylase RimI-like enzyme